jgi:hypothetical protein
MRDPARRLKSVNPTISFFFALIVFVVWAAPTYGDKSAHLVVQPKSGKPRTVLTISGNGFKGGETVEVVVLAGEGVRLGLGTRKVDAIVADKAGKFSVKSAIPRVLKPGTYEIIAEGNKGSQAKHKLAVTK